MRDDCPCTGIHLTLHQCLAEPAFLYGVYRRLLPLRHGTFRPVREDWPDWQETSRFAMDLAPSHWLRTITVRQFVPQVTFIDSMSLDISSLDRSGTRWPGAKAISVPRKSLSLNAWTVAFEPTMTL